MLPSGITRYLLLFGLCVVSTSAETSQSVISAEVRAYVENYVDVVVKDIERKHRAEILALKQTFDTEIKSVKNEATATEITLKLTIDSLTTGLREQNERLIKLEITCEEKNSYSAESKLVEDENDHSAMNHLERGETETKQTNHQREEAYRTSSKRAIKRQSEVETKVAFFATLTPSADNLGVNQDIPFDHAITNIGNGFNAHHGTFIAPVGGVYVFSVTLMANNTYGHVVVNGAVVAKLFIRHAPVLYQSSQTVVVSLKKGEDVSVQNTVLGQSVYGDRYCSFSGFLLYGDIESPIVG